MTAAEMAKLGRLGFLMRPNYLNQHQLEEAQALCALLPSRPKRAGLTRLIDRAPGLAPWMERSGLYRVAQEVLGETARLRRSIFFDKTPEANWKAPWHQDFSIAVKARVETEGFSDWTIKEGVPHVLPPREFLDCSLTLRVHLDPCPEDNGALRVLPGSHNQGPYSTQALYQITRSAESFVCGFPAGGLLLMRPLLLHSSASAAQPTRRRVLHLEFCAGTLPEALQWWEGG